MLIKETKKKKTNPLRYYHYLCFWIFIAVIFPFGTVNAENVLLLNPSGSDSIWVDSATTFDIWIENDDTLGALSIGFKIWSDDGATWTWDSTVLRTDYIIGTNPPEFDTTWSMVGVVEDSRMDPHTFVWDYNSGLQVIERDMDEVSPDSIFIGGVTQSNLGLPPGNLENMIQIHFIPGGPEVGEEFTLCIDSAFIPPLGDFVFCDLETSSAIAPDIYWLPGGRCWTVVKQATSCCVTPGDANHDGACNIGDVVYINNYIYHSLECDVPPGNLVGCPPECAAEGDANADGEVNVGDQVYLINYIFRSQTSPAPVCGPE